MCFEVNMILFIQESNDFQLTLRGKSYTIIIIVMLKDLIMVKKKTDGVGTIGLL